MDAAYDHIQEESFPEDDERRRGGQTAAQDEGKNEQSINQEFQEAYKAFSASPWGVKLGGFWASAKKQVRFPTEEGRLEGTDERVGKADVFVYGTGRTVLRYCDAGGQHGERDGDEGLLGPGQPREDTDHQQSAYFATTRCGDE